MVPDDLSAEAFWINVNIEAGTPSRLGEDFTDEFGVTAESGPLRSKPWLSTSPEPAALEEAVGQHPDLATTLPVRAVIEHNTQLTLADSPRLLSHREGDRLLVWLMVGDRNVASMAFEPLAYGVSGCGYS